MASALESELERACGLLEAATPEAMEASAATLEMVVRELSTRRESIDIHEARRLRAAARRARLLLQLAAQFHLRWHSILAGMTGGYTAQGVPAQFPARGRVSLSA